MMKRILFTSLLLVAGITAADAAPGRAAVDTAQYAVKTYGNAVVDSMAKMISFDTRADEKLPSDRNPTHIAFKDYLKEQAARLGFDYQDYGWVVVIGMGKGSDRLGLITHGDVQPADPAKWKKSPYELDRTSEPGRLVGRGTEDDKGPIATALYAMKAISDRHIHLSKRIELYVYMGEESSWDQLTEFLKTHEPPQMNITFDSQYPAVTAEKAFGMVMVTVPKQGSVPAPADEPYVKSFGGGFFASQIPEDAKATLANAAPELEAAIRARASRQAGMHYDYAWQGKDLVVTAKGRAAHSSGPEKGVNAISMLADALAVKTWPATTAGSVVNFLNEMVGTGYYGDKFGAIAYSDSFMGPMTFAPTVIHQLEDGIQVAINVRRPQGKTTEQFTAEVKAALAQWQAHHVALTNVTVQSAEPWVQKDAPQLPVLMAVFSHFTGMKDPKPVAIGGATNSRMFPHAVSFGPAMPGVEYTGHAEHEFITRKQLLLNLQMYTAALVELAK